VKNVPVFFCHIGVEVIRGIVTLLSLEGVTKHWHVTGSERQAVRICMCSVALHLPYPPLQLGIPYFDTQQPLMPLHTLHSATLADKGGSDAQHG
jgi:hypothetical protein